MGAEPLSTDETEKPEADTQKALDAAWRELDHALSNVAEPTDDGSLALVTPFWSSDELVVVDERRAPQPPALPGTLVHQRHDSSMLFSTTTFREIAMSAMRDFAGPHAGAHVTASSPAAGALQASATVVPVAVPVWPGLDKWLWRSLTVATVALLFFFVAALDLLIVGTR